MYFFSDCPGCFTGERKDDSVELVCKSHCGFIHPPIEAEDSTHTYRYRLETAHFTYIHLSGTIAFARDGAGSAVNFLEHVYGDTERKYERHYSITGDVDHQTRWNILLISVRQANNPLNAMLRWVSKTFKPPTKLAPWFKDKGRFFFCICLFLHYVLP